MLLLASQSPRRAELLRAAGIYFKTFPVDVDETPHNGESPRSYVRRLAEEKAVVASRQRAGDVVLGADTTVVIDGRILAKPVDKADAAAMLRALSGREHEVLTGVALARDGKTLESDVACTRVTFAQLSDEDVHWYVESGEPMDKAGGYAIQGLASRFIPHISGEYSNVVGLPVSLVVALLAKVPDFRR